MIADLKPYPEYRESGLPWLGQVPRHWGALSVKQAFDIQLGKMLQNAPRTTDDSSVPYLKAQHVQWSGVRMSDLPRMWASPHEIVRFGVRCGDLLVCEGGEGGRCAVLKSIPPGVIVQNALHRVRRRFQNDNCFLSHVMAAVSATGWFEAINNKATIAHFTRDKFGSLGIPLPPPAEQAAIVRFLDWANGRLERAIRAKRKVIALLDEQKQVVIHRAVTCGLDASVPFKPSGIPGLGNIPQHWKVERTKNIFRLRTEKSGLAHGKELLSIYTHIGVRPRKDLVQKGNKASTTDDYWIVRKGDLIVNKLLAWMGERSVDVPSCVLLFALLDVGGLLDLGAAILSGCHLSAPQCLRSRPVRAGRVVLISFTVIYSPLSPCAQSL
jgi:type I restriction enzyme, S subunit